MEEEIKNAKDKMNLTELRLKHKDLLEKIGNCPLSTLDVIEAIESNDCMGVCLEIQRNAASIVDPSKLKILNIIPTFMTIDSFLDSAIFTLDKDGNAI